VLVFLLAFGRSFQRAFVMVRRRSFKVNFNEQNEVNFHFNNELTSYQNNDIFYRDIKKEVFMPAIRKSADLRNNYSEISEFCHNYREPVFITKNGQGDLAIMGIETYEEINGRLELYQKILIGLTQIKNGETVPEEAMMTKIKQYAGL